VGLEPLAASPGAAALLQARPGILDAPATRTALLAAAAAGRAWEGREDGLDLRAVPAGDLVTVSLHPRPGGRRPAPSGGAGERQLAHLVAEQAARLTGADRAAVVRLAGGMGEVARWSAGAGAAVPLPDDAARRVRETGGAVRLADPAGGTVIAAPLGPPPDPWGVLVCAAADGAGLAPGAEQVLADLADLAAAALAGAHEREAARHDRAELAALREAAQDGLLVLDRRQAVVHASERFLDAVGLSRDRVVGAVPPYPFWPADRSPLVGHGMSGGHAAGPREVTVGLVRGDGSRLPAVVRVAPLVDPAGALGGHVATVRDLSARARLERALRDREAEESALLRVAALVASGGDTDELAELIAEEAARLLDADLGQVLRFTPGGGTGRLGAWGTEAPGETGAVPAALALQARRTGGTASAPDPGPPAAVAVLITAFQEPWGAICASAHAPRALPPDAAPRLAHFARLAEIAIAKAESRSRMAALVESGITIASGLDLETVLQRLLETARAVLGARYAALGVLSGDGSHLARFLWSGLDEDAAARIGEPPHGGGLLGLLIEHPRPLRVERIGGHPASSGFPAGHPQMASFLGVPITLGDEVFGNLYLTDKVGGPFTSDDERLAETLAAQAAVAVANARTFAAERERLLASAAVQAARVRERAAAEGLRRAIEAQEAERARVARELHDEAGQVLTAIALHLRALEGHVDDAPGRERLAELRRAVNAASVGLRDLATRLRPSGLHEHGLASALERQADRLRESAPIEVDVSLEDLPADLPEAVQITLFRVVQEALTNVARHSGATAVSVMARRHGGRVRVMVEDNGRGFDPDAPTRRLGLVGISERVALLGGELQIESAAGQGCTVVVELDTSGFGGTAEPRA
jgi:PAS domain S-box-containing protein